MPALCLLLTMCFFQYTAKALLLHAFKAHCIHVFSMQLQNAPDAKTSIRGI